MINLDQSARMRRIAGIDRVLRGKVRATLTRMIDASRDEEAEVPSRRTIVRDLKYMRQELKAPIGTPQVTNPDRDGVREYYYRYTDPSWQLEDIVIEKDDILAMTVARELLRHTVGWSPGADALKGTYDKMLGLADDKVRQVANTLVPIAFAGGMNEPVNPEVWNTILQAIRAKKTIRMDYTGAWKKESNRDRRMDPYYIVNLAGEWYVIGTAGLLDTAIRQYKMARIRKVVITDVHFKMPTEFNIDEYLKNVFGRFVGDPRDLVNIKVQFSKRVDTLIKSQRFHCKERRKLLPNGGVIVEFPVSPAGPWPYYHVISWILSWGADAKVLGPAKLKKLVAEECRRMSANDR